MLALAVLVSEIAADSADGKADARLDSGLRTATSLFDEAQGAARPAAKRAAVQIDGDAAALATLHAGDPGRLEDLASQIAREQQLAAVELTDSDGMTVSAGGKPVAAATVRLIDGGGQRIGQVTVATTTSDAFLKRVRDTTGEEAALAGPSGPATGTVSIEAGTVPDPGGSADVELRGDQFRVASTAPLGEEQTRVALFTPAGDEGFFGSRPKVALLFLAFLALAILAVALILRSLQGYVREMLAAARRRSCWSRTSRSSSSQPSWRSRFWSSRCVAGSRAPVSSTRARIAGDRVRNLQVCRAGNRVWSPRESGRGAPEEKER